MHIPDGLDDGERLTYSQGMIAGAETCLQSTNESLFVHLIGAASTARAIMPKLHGQLIHQNRKMLAAMQFVDEGFRREALDALTAATAAVGLRNKVLHSTWALDLDPGKATRMNALPSEDRVWEFDRFNEAYDDLRRAAVRTFAVARIVSFSVRGDDDSEGDMWRATVRGEFSLTWNGGWVMNTDMPA